MADTRLCLASLGRQVDLGADHLEVIVVDNGSEDGTHLLAAEFPEVRILRQAQNLGFAGGVNVGLRAATGELLTILNNDTMAAPHLFAYMRKVLHSDPRIGLVAPVSNHVKGSARIDVGQLGQSAAERADIEDAISETAVQIQDQETLSGLCLMMRRELIEQIGLFDERFGSGNFEDDDFSLRARLHGHRLVIARHAFLFHRGHRTFSSMGLDFKATLDEKERIFRDKWEQDPAGQAYIARLARRTDIAAVAALKAIALYPSWLDGDLTLGRMRAIEGNHPAAVQHLTAFVTHCPQHSEARLQLALSRLYAGDTNGGMLAFKDTLSECFFPADKLSGALEQFACWCLDDSRHALALDHLETARSISPERGETYNLIGVTHMAVDNLPQAQSALETADEMGDSNGTTNLGICHWRAGNRQVAVQFLEKAVRDDPNNLAARKNYDMVAEALAAAQQG